MPGAATQTQTNYARKRKSPWGLGMKFRGRMLTQNKVGPKQQDLRSRVCARVLTYVQTCQLA